MQEDAEDRWYIVATAAALGLFPLMIALILVLTFPWDGRWLILAGWTSALWLTCLASANIGNFPMRLAHTAAFASYFCTTFMFVTGSIWHLPLVLLVAAAATTAGMAAQWWRSRHG